MTSCEFISEFVSTFFSEFVGEFVKRYYILLSGYISNGLLLTTRGWLGLAEGVSGWPKWFPASRGGFRLAQVVSGWPGSFILSYKNTCIFVTLGTLLKLVAL